MKPIRIVEALVAVGIIGILIAMLLPAQQSAREAARAHMQDASSFTPAAGSAVARPAAKLALETRERAPIVDPDGEIVIAPEAPAKPDGSAKTPRKIIYSADVDVVVDNVPKTTEAVSSLVSKFGGYIADTDITGSTGSHRRANWKVRVPIEKFDEFLDAASKLGELQRRQIHSQDVTEEFYDLSARIKNKKVEEGRLVKHLEESTGKLKEILDVEREISRVREEVERMEGRVRLLANLTDLTTVTITADERIGYIPASAPTFGTRVSRTWEYSTKKLTDSLENTALMAISVVPWLPFWIVGLLIFWFLIRRAYRRYPAFFSLPRRPRPA